MKRAILLLMVILVTVFCAESCSADIKVNIKGEKPTIVELFRAYAEWRAGKPANDESKELTNGAYNYIWLGKPAHKDGKNVFDKKVVDIGGGYLSYTGGGTPGAILECCFWNTADRKNIIFAANFTNENFGSAHTYRLDFFLYDNTTGTMKKIDPPFNIRYESQQWNDRFASTEMRCVAFRLPRKGKDIKAKITGHNEHGETIDREELLKWNGRGFSVK